MIKLKYGNTNTFYIPGSMGGLLVDTDYAGTQRAFYQALKAHGLQVKDIAFVLATHYHPDHMGQIGSLMKQGVRLLLVDIQRTSVHFSDGIFARDGLPFEPIDTANAEIIRCQDSRRFLAGMGIAGEIIPTPSHSDDSVSVILDDGDCFVGDLEPIEYLDAYENNEKLKADWELLMAHRPKRVFYAHMNEKCFDKAR